MRFRLPRRLSWKLLAAILPPVVAAVGCFGWLQYGIARREILDSIDRQIHILAQRTAGNIDELFDQRHRELLTLAETPLIADYYHNVDYSLLDEAEAYRKELERYLGHFAARSHAYARILYLDASGRVICRVGAAPGAEAGFPPRDFAAAAKGTAADFWVSPVEELAGVGPLVYYAKPVRDDLGELKGMLVLGYTLAQLEDLLKSIEVGKRGRAYVRTQDGRQLEGRAPVRDKEMLTASCALTRRPWTVFVEAPLDDFLEPLRIVRSAAALTASLGGALLLVILLLLVRSITRPIAALVTAAQKIGGGDLGYRIQAVGTDDELGTLSGAFNEMAERLDANRKQTVQLQSQLIQAEKLSAVGQLISAVAHELNNPLAAISGYAQMALMDECPPRLRDDLEHLYKNVLRCRKVVDNLLFFVRQSRQERRRVNLNEAAASALELLEYRLVKTENVRVVKELAERSPEIAGDFQQIVQVLVNLVGNACDAMERPAYRPEGKILTIRTGAQGRPFIDIQDNGAGIAPELREKVFQPFFTTKEPGRGTGLGLPICRQIVREHGGDIGLESFPGGGTVFRLNFPPAREEDFESSEAPAAPASFPAVPGKKILVADDEEDIAAVVARLLTEDGDVVHAVHTGAEALRLLEAGAYDLVISDIEMEHAKGTDLHAALAAQGALPACRMLFITGEILNPKVLEFLSRTKSEYLVKPFDLQELRQVARRLLGAPEGRAVPPI